MLSICINSNPKCNLSLCQIPAVSGQKCGGDKQLEFDHTQIIFDFHIIGHGLVDSIRDNRTN